MEGGQKASHHRLQGLHARGAARIGGAQYRGAAVRERQKRGNLKCRRLERFELRPGLGARRDTGWFIARKTGGVHGESAEDPRRRRIGRCATWQGLAAL